MQSSITPKITGNRPLFSCIITTFNEGELARVAIDSILEQTYEDFELIVVDDGADATTRRTIQDYRDERIRIVTQTNDGLSSARNRGITLARGSYLCFLDADDLRPAWSLASVAAIIAVKQPDCVFVPGTLVGLRNESLPFYDAEVFSALSMILGSDHWCKIGSSIFDACSDMLTLIEPQSANKFLRRDFVLENHLRFPSGLLFEDMLFHVAILSKMTSVAISDIPGFTYFRRYGRPQITSSSSINRFDAISVATMALSLFARSAKFHRANMRLGILVSTFKVIEWCEGQISRAHKFQFRQAVRKMISNMDDKYLATLDISSARGSVLQIAPWSAKALTYLIDVRSDY